MKRAKRRRKVKQLQDIQESDREIQRLRDKYEPEIVELVAVAPAGPDQMLRAGHTADGRWVERIESV